MTEPINPDDDHRPGRVPRPGEEGWSSTDWPNTAGNGSMGRSAMPITGDWQELPVSAPTAEPGWPNSKGDYEPLPSVLPAPHPAERLGSKTGEQSAPEVGIGPDPEATDSTGLGSQRSPGPDPTTMRFSTDAPYRPPSLGSTGSSGGRPAGASSGGDPIGAAGQPDTTDRLEPVDEAGAVRDRVTALVGRLRRAARVEALDDSFSLGHLFGESFRRRPQSDVERELMVGTAATTPPLSQVEAEWPQPWLFVRTMLAAGAVLALFFIGWSVFGAVTLLPGLIIVGSFAVPIAALIFFFEINVAKNVSIVAVLRMVFLGGAASLLFSLIGFELIDFPWLGAMVTAVVTEPAKLLAVVLVARQVQHRFVLNGVLFGAAVGAGFAAFDSAGYALVAALFALDNSEVIDNIVLRGLLSPFGHIIWTAIAAGALWRVKGGERLRVGHLKDPRFWRILVLVIVLQAIWNSPIPSLLYLKFIALGAIAWLVCLSLLQEGIGQIRSEQAQGSQSGF